MEFSPSPSRSSLYKQKKPHSANALDRYCLLLLKKAKETLHLISIISIKMEMVSKKITCVALLCMLVIAVAPGAEALTCGTVVGALTPCLGYLQGGPLAASCCGGIKSLVSQAKTPADRRTACNCLKSAAGTIKNIDYGKAAGLPGKCGANIPYKISPSTNCNSVN